MEEKQMKKGLIVAPAVILGIPIVLVATLVVLLSGKGPKSDFVPEEDVTAEKFLLKQIGKTFSNIESEQKLSFGIEEDSFNQLLYTASADMKKSMDIPEEVSEYVQIGDIFMTIDENDYNFYLNVDTKFGIGTHLALETKLEEKEVETKPAYVFTLENVKVGKLGLLGLAGQLGLLNSINLEDAFKGSGLSIKSDLKNNRLYYYVDDMEADLKKMMTGGDSGSSSDTDNLLKDFFEMIDLHLDFKNGIHAIADLSKFVKNDEFSDSGEAHYAGYAEKKAIIAAAVKTAKEELAAGKSTSAVKESLEAVLNSTLQKEVEEGQDVNSIVTRELESLTPKDGVETAQILAEMAAGTYEKTVSLSESEIDNVLASTGIIGKSFVFSFGDELVYIAIDNLYCDLFVRNNEQYLTFTVGINLNGLETRAIIEMKLVSLNNKLAGTFAFENIYLGELPVGTGLKNTIQKYVKEAIQGMENNSWITYTEAGSPGIKIDFEELFFSSADLTVFKGYLDLYCSRDMSIKNEVVSGQEKVVNGDGIFALHFKSNGLI